MFRTRRRIALAALAVAPVLAVTANSASAVIPSDGGGAGPSVVAQSGPSHFIQKIKGLTAIETANNTIVKVVWVRNANGTFTVTWTTKGTNFAATPGAVYSYQVAAGNGPKTKARPGNPAMADWGGISVSFHGRNAPSETVWFYSLNRYDTGARVVVNHKTNQISLENIPRYQVPHGAFTTNSFTSRETAKGGAQVRALSISPTDQHIEL